VVAVARISSELAHSIADGHGTAQVIPFLQVFFAIWWAWMNFTWFASAYDNDDAIFRVLTMVQMGGALLLASGVADAFNRDDYGAITWGYLIMRVALVALWVRAAVDCPPGRLTAVRYAAGILGLEVLWVLRLVLATHGVLGRDVLLPVFVGLVLLELAVPWCAERAGQTAWHPHHIAERYGLFAIILLGEGLLAASSRIPAALDEAAGRGEIALTALTSFVLVMELWWLYFLNDVGVGLARNRARGFLWGYAQYAVFASLVALSAGLEVSVEHAAGLTSASPTSVAYAVAIPVALFLCALPLVDRALVGRDPSKSTLIGPACAALVLLSVAAAGPLAAISGSAVVLALLIAVESAARRPRSGTNDVGHR
jgi:low temperature requirement protein LtrA